MSLLEVLSAHRNGVRLRATAAISLLGARGQILDMPDEILLDIFGYVAAERDDTSTPFPELQDVQYNSEEMQNCRLVCRRFHEVSSQLLVRVLRVRPSRTSLERLDRISRHPLFAKGVHTVYIDLHFYASRFIDFGHFLSYHLEDIGDQFACRDEEWRELPDTFALGLEPLEQIQMVYDTMARIELAERDSPSAMEVGDQAHRARLAEFHGQYLTLLSEQKLLIDSGEFTQAVGSAVARMPCARKVVFTDRDGAMDMECKLYAGLDLGKDVWSSLQDEMIQPCGPNRAGGHESDIPGYGSIIIGTLTAIVNNHTWLESIAIKFTRLNVGRSNPLQGEDPSGQLPFTQDARRHVTTGMRQLKHFTFDGANRGQIADIPEFLSACLDTPSLRALELNIKYQIPRHPDDPRLDMGETLGSRTRPNLTTLDLVNVSISLPTLARLLRRLPEPMDYIGLSKVYLRPGPDEEGTWEEALDLLRGKTCRKWHLDSPRGGELAAGTDMFVEVFGKFDEVILFGPRRSYRTLPTPAEIYVARLVPGEANPLQRLRERMQAADDEAQTDVADGVQMGD